MKRNTYKSMPDSSGYFGKYGGRFVAETLIPLILEVENANTVLFLKRSMASGYSGVDNELFFRDNTMMLFGDAKEMTDSIVQSLG